MITINVSDNKEEIEKHQEITQPIRKNKRNDNNCRFCCCCFYCQEKKNNILIKNYSLFECSSHTNTHRDFWYQRKYQVQRQTDNPSPTNEPSRQIVCERLSDQISLFPLILSPTPQHNQRRPFIIIIVIK